MTTDVCVIGAGVSGLTVAHRLTRRGLSVLVLERASSAGGVIASSRACWRALQPTVTLH